MINKILCVAAHPDDLDFGAAGTISLWTSLGIEVIYLIVTDGDAGGEDRSITRRDMAKLRQHEQREAAKTVGVSDVRFLGYKDGAVTATIELRKDISRAIREVQPDRMLIPSPERFWDRIYASHPDHMAVGEAAIFAIYPDARNPFAHETLLQEGLEPFSVKETWIMASPSSFEGPKDDFDPAKCSYDAIEPTKFRTSKSTWVAAVDITDTFHKKCNALKQHKSQTDQMDDLEGMLRLWTGFNSSLYKVGADRLAEAFQVVDTN